MTPRERIVSALTFQPCDQVPIEARDVSGPGIEYPLWYEGTAIGKKGSYTDLWGCKWVALEDEVCGEVKNHPLEDWSAFDQFHPPMDYLKELDLSAVNAYCASTDRFVAPMWEPAMPNIFERMQHLRGTENLFIDLAEEEPYIDRLIDRLNEYYFPLMEKWAKTDVDALHIADDWGSQTSLLISPTTWRCVFKPIYKQYADIAKRHGKFILMHSDGFIEPILPDLIEIGIDSINSQIFCMDMEKLAAQYHGKIAFWGELDRQYLQVFGTPDEVRAGVRRLANAFFSHGKTGFIAQCYYTPGTPEANKQAEWEEWARISETEDWR